VTDALLADRRGLRRESPQRDRPGLEPDVMHPEEGKEEQRYEQTRADEKWEREVDLAQKAATDRSNKHRHTADDLTGGENPIHISVEPQRTYSVDEPCLHCARIEGVSEAHEHGDQREADDASANLCKADVCEGRRCKDDEREQERGPASDRVGNDAGRNLEQDGPDGERCVGDKRLSDRQPCAEEEQGVDPPDDRSGERIDARIRVVPANESGRRRGMVGVVAIGAAYASSQNHVRHCRFSTTTGASMVWPR